VEKHGGYIWGWGLISYYIGAKAWTHEIRARSRVLNSTTFKTAEDPAAPPQKFAPDSEQQKQTTLVFRVQSVVYHYALQNHVIE